MLGFSLVQILNQHSDAKELAALYINSGVPIYPRSLGHSYHTLAWRMRIEALEMQAVSPTPSDIVNVEDGSNDPVPGPIDRFFVERYVLRVMDGMNYPMSYLEEKSLYMLNAAKQSSDGNSMVRSIPRRMAAPQNHVAARPGVPHHHLPHHHVHDRLHDANFNGQVQHVPHLSRWQSLEVPSGQTRGRGLMKSKSHTDLRSQEPKVLVKVHRHLLDQHLLGRPFVDDKNGAMMTAPINLGADFFHPIFKVRNQSFSRNSIQPQKSLSPGDGLGSGEHLRTTNRGESALNASATRGDVNVDRLGESGTGAFGPGISFVETTDSDLAAAQGIFEPPNRGTDDVVAATRRGDESASTLVMNPILANPPSTANHGTILVNVDLDVYSAATMRKECGTNPSNERAVLNQLRSRFSFYTRRFEDMLGKQDSHGFDECLLDFWDEFLPQTAGIHYFDQYTAVPRISCLEQFLTKPCPKAIGVLQCEIERIKVGPKKKGVNMKGRFFPTYEYRLFVRHRPPDTMDGSEPPRRDTVLMMAKNKGRKQFEVDGSCASSKKGANNYFLYLPDRDDVERHSRSVNVIDMPSNATVYNGAGSSSMHTPVPTLMGRLQSNFIGTEFQIFRPQSNTKIPPEKSCKTALPSAMNSASGSEDEKGYDSGGVSSDNANSNRRRGRFARLSLRRSAAGNSSESSTITEVETPVSNPIRRSRSSGDMNMGSRRIRISRRAIANNSEEPVLHGVPPAPLEMEDGAITYTANLLGSRPRIMDVCIPKVSPEGVSGLEWKKYLDKCVQDSDGVGSNRMLNHLKQMLQRMENEDRSLRPTIRADAFDEADDYSPPEDFGLLSLQNRPPWWNIELGSFVLNFGGRVSVASVKNFQLCDRNDQDYIMLQFGRIQGRHSFTMDFRHPLTAVQAFAIAISSLQSKLSLG